MFSRIRRGAGAVTHDPPQVRLFTVITVQTSIFHARMYLTLLHFLSVHFLKACINGDFEF